MIRRRQIVWLAVFALSTAAVQECVVAQVKTVQPVSGAMQYIRLTIGKGGLFKSPAPYAKISVSDEKVVEVTPQSDLAFILNPKSVGTTNVYMLDDRNRLIAGLDIEVVGKSVRLRDEGDDVVIYRSLSKPARYQCNGTGCETAPEAPPPSLTAEESAPGMKTPASKPAEPEKAP